MAQPSRTEAQEFIHDQDLICIECHRSGDPNIDPQETAYLRYQGLSDGVWHLVCQRDRHHYTVRVAERPSADDLDSITMTWLGTWAQFGFAPSKGD